MTALQLGFLVALSVVLLAVLAFGALMVRAAVASDGGPYPTRRLLRSREARVEANRWAFYAHRLTGVAIFGFLCLHVLDVSLYALSPERFDDLHAVYGSAAMRVFECGLLVAILFHTFNGLRILAIDVGDLGAVAARRALSATLALSMLLGAVGAVAILRPLVA